MNLRLSGGRKLQSPPGDKARPTASRVRLAVMNLLAADLRGAAWLDLFSGSGVMACEALQRGASRVVAVEQDRRIAAVTRHNLALLQPRSSRQTPDVEGMPEHGPGGRATHPASASDSACATVELHTCEAIRWLQRGCSGAGFDIIYADPPYGAGLYPAIAAAVANGKWLLPGGTLILECGSSSLPELQEGWSERFRRRYGETTLLGLTEPRP